MGWDSFDVRFEIAKPKNAYNSLVIGPSGLQCETNLSEIMSWESFDMVRFDLGPHLEVLITCLLLILEACNVKPTYRKSWAGNLLMSDLSLGSSFKVKRWLIGFGEVSFWWIQFALVLSCARSSFK